MIKRIYFMLLLILGTIALCLAYREDSPIYMLGAELIFVSLIHLGALINWLFFGVKSLKVEKYVNSCAMEKIKILFYGGLFFFPVRSEACFELINLNNMEKTKIKAPFMVSMACRRVEFPFVFDTSGKYRITLKRVYVFDACGLIGIRKTIKNSRELYVFPQIYDVNVENNMASVGYGITTSSEEENYYKDHPGDDPSEIFDFREYRQGDKLTHINWKLSARKQSLFVKEMSDPIIDGICIVYGINSKCLKAADAARSVIFSLINGFYEKEIPFSVMYRGEGIEESIIHVLDDDSKRNSMLLTLDNAGIDIKKLRMILLDEEKLKNQHRILYITDTFARTELDKITGIEGRENFFVLSVVDNDELISDSEFLSFLHYSSLREELLEMSFEII